MHIPQDFHSGMTVEAQQARTGPHLKVVKLRQTNSLLH